MSRLQLVVICTAVVQLVVAAIRFVLVAANPGTRAGTILNFVALVVCGILGLVTQRTGAMSRSAVALNWVLAVLWSWGLLGAIGRATNDPELANWLPTVVGCTLAIIIPCAINGVAVAFLPKRTAGNPRTEAKPSHDNAYSRLADGSLDDVLLRFADLKAKGVVTDEQFAAMMAKLYSSLSTATPPETRVGDERSGPGVYR